jgi:NADH:ubiquinone oxidoreductase subunit 2 (subunit N)
LISLYLAIEIQSLCLYVLAASKKDYSFSLEAGLKYFILGSFSSALFLFGSSLLYGCVGTTNFNSFSLFFFNLDNFFLNISVEHA